MPYRSPTDRRENRALKRLVKSRELYRNMGLERIGNRVWCTYCLKETRASSSHRFRHMDDCPMLAATASIIGIPMELMNATLNPYLRAGYCQLQLKL